MNKIKRNEQGFSVVELVIAAAIIIIISIVGYLIYKDHHKTITTTKQSNLVSQKITTLNISSTPSDIQMTGSPICNSVTLNKTTPYTCTQAKGSLNTTITAPTQVTIADQSYTFTTWNGCSASNRNKAICKVSVNEGDANGISAIYVKSSATSSSSTSTNQTPTFSCVNNDSNNDGYATCIVDILTAPSTFSVSIKNIDDANNSIGLPASQLTCSEANACLDNQGTPTQTTGNAFYNIYPLKIVKATNIVVRTKLEDTTAAGLCGMGNGFSSENVKFDSWVTSSTASSATITANYTVVTPPTCPGQ